MPADPKLVRDHFLAAAELGVAEREAYLTAHCGDADLRAAVERLLAAHDQPASVLNRPVPSDPEQTRSGVPSEQPGAVIAGRYKLLEEIGEGGMGTVWVAEQTEPVRRKVALKLIKAGMDSKSLLARFEAERQALAVMDHPNIAKVLDGGLTETGRPYFVMEYVKGVPITEYCDATRLSVPERLNLFVQVCHAVQHAHQKGIIHRDLKPSNILVAPYDDKPVPKVIDFGLAKAMHQSLTERTLHTAHETVLGTPLYMSPEQAQLNNLDVDTRSDIYSLGVLLYELLTGTTPLEKRRFKEAAWDEIKRIIREEEPPRPSTRLSSTTTLPSLAAGRQTEPAKLTKLVRGELDWIVMKALEKDRTRRYETANGFGMDIQRYLAGEPVLAAPPSARYRLRKFARKHRAVLTAAAAIVVLLIAGVTVSTWQAVRATHAEAESKRQSDAATKAEQKSRADRDRAIAAEARASEEAAIAKTINDFLQNDLLARMGAEGNPNSDLKLRTVLDSASQRIEGRFTRQPIIEAAIRTTIGQAYWNIGMYTESGSHFQRAYALRRQHLGDDHLDTLQSMQSVALIYSGQGKFQEAEALMTQCLDIHRRLQGPEHADTFRALNALAVLYTGQSKAAMAEPLFEEILERQRRVYGPTDPQTLHAMNSLGTVYMNLGKHQKAEPLFQATLKEVLHTNGKEYLGTGWTMMCLAGCYLKQGRQNDAEPLFREGLEIIGRVRGPEHTDTVTAMFALADLCRVQGRYAEAEDLMRKGWETRRRVLGEGASDTLGALQALAELYRTETKYKEAADLYEKLLLMRRSNPGEKHPVTLRVEDRLASLYLTAGMFDQALSFLEDILKRRKAKLGADHADTLNSMNSLASAYKNAKKLDLALPLYEETLKLRKAKFGPDHAGTLLTMSNLAVAYWSAKQLEKSVPLFEDLLKLREAKFGRNDPDTLGTVANLGVNYKDAGRLAEALPLLEEAYRAAPKHPNLRFVGTPLLTVYAKAGKTQQAAALTKELLTEARTQLPKDSPQLAGKLATFSLSLLQAKAFGEAEPLLRECLAIREKQEPEAWTTFNTTSRLGETLLGQKKYADAEPLLLKGCEGMKQREKAIPPQGKIRIAEAIERLVQLYEATDKKDDAAKWRKELEVARAAAKPAVEKK